MVIGTALAAEADWLVTGDKPLLGLGEVGRVRLLSVTEALALIEARAQPVPQARS